MGIQSVNHVQPAIQQYDTTPQKQEQEVKEEAQKVQPKTDSFVKSETREEYGYGKVKGLSQETIDGIKEERINSLKNMVQKIISGQAEKATGITSFDFKLSIEFSSTHEIKGSIYDDPVFGVDAVATRIMDMAVALSGGDAEKAETLKNAVMKGFGQAEEAWGDKLPGVCQATKAELERRFDYWMENRTLEGYKYTGYDVVEE